MEFLKEHVFNNISFGKVWWSSRNPIIIVYTLGGCGGLERNSFLTVSTFGECGGLERNSFLTVSPLGGVVVFKGLIFPVSTLKACGVLKRTHF